MIIIKLAPKKPVWAYGLSCKWTVNMFWEQFLWGGKSLNLTPCSRESASLCPTCGKEIRLMTMRQAKKLRPRFFSSWILWVFSIYIQHCWCISFCFWMLSPNYHKWIEKIMMQILGKGTVVHRKHINGIEKDKKN